MRSSLRIACRGQHIERWLLPRDELAQVLRRWPDVIWGTATQYISMPLLAYGVAKLYGFEGSIKAGVIIVGCVPGAMADLAT